MFGTEEAGKWHQKDRHGFEAVEINGRIHAEDKLLGGKRREGRKISMGKMTERRMKRTVTRLLTSGEKVTARKVKEKCELDLNVRTVQRTLHRIGLKYAKAKKKITLTKKHKEARLECAKRWLTKHVDLYIYIY